MDFIPLILLLFLKNVLSMMNYDESFESIPILGGNYSKPGEIKYIASIHYNDEHHCGGGILSNTHIITAARCIIDENNHFVKGPIKIIAGVNNLFGKTPTKVEILVEKAYVPNEYNNSRKYRADIAILKLKTNLDLSNNVNLEKLRLPRKQDNFENKNVTIAGFGWDEVILRRSDDGSIIEDGSSLGKLSSAIANVISNEDCEEDHYDDIGDTELCAKIIKDKFDRFYGTCRGDEGGPLVYKSNVIIGILITSQWGCNEVLDPGRYTRVTSFLDFIRNSMQGETDARVHNY